MGKSKVAMVLTGRDAMSKKAKADADNDDVDERLKMQVLAGPYGSMKGLAYSSPSFDTVRLCKGVFSGKWYYEVHLGEKRNMQIGFALNGFNVAHSSGDGVGDKGAESRSWAYDGGRQRKWSYGWISYGNNVKWKAGDVVGCLLDLENNQV
jgi:hypothetical protein